MGMEAVLGEDWDRKRWRDGKEQDWGWDGVRVEIGSGFGLQWDGGLGLGLRWSRIGAGMGSDLEMGLRLELG